MPVWIKWAEGSIDHYAHATAFEVHGDLAITLKVYDKHDTFLAGSAKAITTVEAVAAQWGWAPKQPELPLSSGMMPPRVPQDHYAENSDIPQSPVATTETGAMPIDGDEFSYRDLDHTRKMQGYDPAEQRMSGGGMTSARDEAREIPGVKSNTTILPQSPVATTETGGHLIEPPIARSSPLFKQASDERGSARVNDNTVNESMLKAARVRYNKALAAEREMRSEQSIAAREAAAYDVEIWSEPLPPAYVTRAPRPDREPDDYEDDGRG